MLWYILYQTNETMVRIFYYLGIYIYIYYIPTTANDIRRATDIYTDI